MSHIQTEEEWQAEMSLKVMNFIKREVYQELPYMSVAIESLALAPAGEFARTGISGQTGITDDFVTLSSTTGRYFATDGETLYFHPESVNRIFKANSRFLDRALLHSLFHCLLYHPWFGPREEMTEDERKLYGLACDIVVEQLVDQLNKPCTGRPLSLIRKEFYDRMKKECPLPTAMAVFRMLSYETEESLLSLSGEFAVDDHKLWPQPQKGMPMPAESQALAKKWEKINHQTQLLQKSGREAGAEAADRLSDYLARQKKQRNYADFLKQFTILREETRVDPDSFDYGYYNYGLTLYKNMPLIEEQESRESRKISSFVIVIDTSDSTRGELVRNFLQETRDVLMSTGSFFEKADIHLIQADDDIRWHRVIRGPEDFDRLLKSDELKIYGGGGTDFRPAFSYVEELRTEGGLTDINGLLYYTDGEGVYPKKKPDYKVAFLFRNDYNNEAVPAWAMRLLLR